MMLLNPIHSTYLNRHSALKPATQAIAEQQEVEELTDGQDDLTAVEQ